MHAHLRSTVVALGLGALLVSCASGPSPSETPAPSASASSSATPTVTPTEPTPTVSITPSPDSTLRAPTGMGDDLTFGFSDFEGSPVGSTIDEFSSATGLVSTWCNRGMSNFFPPGTDAEDWDWLLWGPSRPNESNPEDLGGGAAEGWTIDFFALQPNWGVDASEPFGPTGPGGIRLGSTDDDVSEAFPDVRVVERSVIDEQHYGEEPVTFLDYTYDAPDGTSIVFVVRDGLVVAIYWGSADLVDGPLFAGCD